jgi:hypothetical protein
MNEPFDSVADPVPERLEKRKLWRNIFLLNLCVSLLLVGIFWLPAKLVDLDDFLGSPSVNVPGEGEVAKDADKKAELAPASPSNLMTTHITTVNASSEKDFVYFDFSSGKAVKILDSSSLEWDLAFRRGKVISNGGASSRLGQAGLINLGDVEFDTVVNVPRHDYVEDAAAKTETENPVMIKWYNYNYLTHKLTAKKNIYAIKTANGKFAKFQFLSFYCANKEAGCIKIQYVYQDNGTSSFLKTEGAVATTS